MHLNRENDGETSDTTVVYIYSPLYIYIYMIDLIIRTLMYMYSVVCNAAKVVVMTNDAFVYGNKEK